MRLSRAKARLNDKVYLLHEASSSRLGEVASWFIEYIETNTERQAE